MLNAQFDGIKIPDLPYQMTPRNGELIPRDDSHNLIGTLRPTDVVVIGEDGIIRTMSDTVHKSKYEVLK